MRPATKSAAGFSLLELLGAMAIVAMLFGLAIPSWREHVRKVKRAEAASMLLHAATRQEQFRLANHRYANGAELFLAPPAGLGLAANNESYELRVLAGPESFLLSASVKPNGSQADDERCQQLGINQAGRRIAYDKNGRDTAEHCWPGR